MRFVFFLIFYLTASLAFGAYEQLVLPQGQFSFFSSHTWHQPLKGIQKIILVVHGSERNADRYFATMNGLAQNLAPGKVLVIAPHFKESHDIRTAEEFIFSPEGWLSGLGALNAPEISSFHVLEELLKKFIQNENLPDLKEVIITGHSAGGQLTQRLALGTKLPDEFKNVDWRFVVLNPGSYTYLTPQRPFPIEDGCSFNLYKYGLKGLPSYFTGLVENQIIQQYLSRNVTYLVGEKDNDVAGIDQSCEARSQGSHRLERAQNFKRLLDEQFFHAHQIEVIPGIGHTQHGMYHSEIGRFILFKRPL
jgi:hypothetical protein